MATVTLHQVRSPAGPNGYTVTNTVTAASNIPSELFVFDATTSKFAYVATPADFLYPTVLDPLQGFYRQASCAQSFTSVYDAIDFASNVKDRIDKVVKDFTANAAAFPGTDDTNFPRP